VVNEKDERHEKGHGKKRAALSLSRTALPLWRQPECKRDVFVFFMEELPCKMIRSMRGPRNSRRPAQIDGV